ncbi:MAG: cysL 2 [Firmicutes bacterium]|nr:cysL 2 [Bacillota bacterium]
MSYLHSLSVFSTVVEEKSFSAAAKKIGLTQPTVSFHIDNLEKKFDCPLFTRTAKGVTLTTYGEKLYESTQKIHRIAEDTENHIKSLVAGNAGEINIGASTIPGEYILPDIIADFVKLHPRIKFSITTGDSATISLGYQQGKFPIAIVGSEPDSSLPSQPLWRDQLVLAAHPQMVAKLGSNAAIAEILALPFVFRKSSSGTRNTVLRALSKHGILLDKLNIALQVSGNQALKTAILGQAGIGFISTWAIQQELADGRLISVPLPGIELSRTFYASREVPLMPTCVEDFWQFLHLYSF